MCERVGHKIAELLNSDNIIKLPLIYSFVYPRSILKDRYSPAGEVILKANADGHKLTVPRCNCSGIGFEILATGTKKC